MNLFGWSLPAGCGMLPDEVDTPPICERCSEEDCIGEENCFRFLYFLRRETFYNEDTDLKYD